MPAHDKFLDAMKGAQIFLQIAVRDDLYVTQTYSVAFTADWYRCEDFAELYLPGIGYVDYPLFQSIIAEIQSVGRTNRRRDR